MQKSTGYFIGKDKMLMPKKYTLDKLIKVLSHFMLAHGYIISVLKISSCSISFSD
jgi:hypothetical protein